MADSKFYDRLRKNEWQVVNKIGPSSRIRFSIIQHLMKKYVLNAKETVVLDSGCGSGEFLRYLSNRGYQNLNGTDFSKEALKQTKKKIKGDFYLANLDKKSALKKNSCDLIVCSEVLEHVEKDREAIKSMHEALRKGGYLFISVPFLMSNWSHHDDFSGHIRRYEPGELEKKLMDNSFKVKESFSWGNFVYAAYYVLLRKFKAQTLMKKETKNKTPLIQDVLFYLFQIDRLFPSKYKGQKLFLVAKKNE